MTPESMRVVAAESLGWRYKQSYQSDGYFTWHNPDDRLGSPPRYEVDLNAVAELELSLKTSEEHDSYIRYLCVMLGLPMPFEANTLDIWWAVKTAKPLVCLEAYLRTKGLYKE